MAEPAPRTDVDLVAVSRDVIAAGQASSGALVAGPTFSQYGYSWFRDGAFIAEALDLAGDRGRSTRFHEWVAAVVLDADERLERARTMARAGQVPDSADYLHCRYTADGQHADEDWPAFQLDGPGIWLWSLARHVELGGRVDADMAAAGARVARYLADLWPIPCADAWEEFSDRVHTSTLAAIAAGLRAAVQLWPELGHDQTVTSAQGAIDARLAAGEGAYTKWAGSDAVDASLLWMAAPYRLLAPSEPRFAATLQRIEAELTSDGLGVHRYVADTYYGGGAWPVLSSAYGRVLLQRDAPGDVEQAIRILRWIEAQADVDGRLPEQVADRALAPDRIDEWRELWGESARPLLWSHAAYLALHVELHRLGVLDETRG